MRWSRTRETVRKSAQTFSNAKTIIDNGTENTNDFVSIEVSERPLGFAACQSKNHDGVKGYG